MEGIKGKVALVTGASRGIGAATAEALAAEGALVAVNYHRSGDKAGDVLARIKDAGGEGLVVQCDVAEYDGVQRMASEVRDAARDPEILVNNAGIHQHLKSWELSPADWQRVIGVNLTGVYNCARAFVPGMKEKGWGRVVNVSSVVAFTGTDHEVHYAASKGGMVSLTRSLALELAPYGVRVNAIAPGYIETDMTGEATPAELAAGIAQVPLGRIGRPKEIADAVLYLCSEMSSYVTGQTLHVNGGMAFP